LYPKNLIVLSNFSLDLDPNDFSLLCSVDLLVLDLHGTQRLYKVPVFPADMDSVSHFEFAISDFNGAHAQTGKVVSDPANQFFFCLSVQINSPLIAPPIFANKKPAHSSDNKSQRAAGSEFFISSL
jgi:hypothetical protein